MNSVPTAGELAPDFQLQDDQGRAHRLSDRRGRYTVVYFYPVDDTPGCTTEACSFRDSHGAFEATGTEVWGISPQGPESKAAFRAKYGLPFTLLADEDHQVAERYGVWVEKDYGGKKSWGNARTSFLVGPDGRIDRVWEKVNPDGHADQVLAALQQEGVAAAVTQPSPRSNS